MKIFRNVNALTLSKMPMTRLGWSKYYADRHNKTLATDCVHLALWYQFLHEAFGDSDISPRLKKPIQKKVSEYF